MLPTPAQRGASLLRDALEPGTLAEPRLRAATANWRKVAQQAAQAKDPWRDLTAACGVERAEELVYDVAADTWTAHEILVRIDLDRPVAKGRMRECFRLKKLALPRAGDDASDLSPSRALSLDRSVSASSQFSQEQEPRILSIVRQLSGDDDTKIRSGYTACDMEEWASICAEPIFSVLHNLGRRTACRVRTRLGLKAVSFHHPTILTVGEVMACVRARGSRSVEIAFAEEGHGLQDQDFADLAALVRRAQKDDLCWERPSLNFMAKRYMAAKDDLREVYEGDVIMQEVCKLLSVQFNAHEPAPPKLIDMLHVGLIRLVDRPGQPCLGYESFVQGRYHKWNTNAGWADTVTVRHTPHAFSFASFRDTQGAMMVVDIQGVNDLYTDPQVHTRDGIGFGEGNLGARGMALFLRHFRFDLNPVVQYMRYTPFALMPDEQGAASEDEIEKFRAGQAYLRSQAWSRRRQLSRQSSNSSSAASATSLDAHDIALDQGLDIDDDAFGVPEFLLNCADSLAVGECPARFSTRIPRTETAEAAVHAALARLYFEADERVVCPDVDPDEANRFHTWMAALAGSRDAMMACAEHPSTPATSVVNWYHAAALAGSRAACLSALARIPSQDFVLAIFFVQRALAIDDGKTDAQRKLDMEPTQHELHAQLGAAYRSLGEVATSQLNFQAAADLALEAGDFRCHERYLAELDV